MLSAFIFALGLAFQEKTATLEFRNGVFVSTGPGYTEKIPITEKTLPKVTTFEFEDGDTRISWGPNGMTVQVGAYHRTTRFVDVPTSPRLFSKEQIQEAIKEVENGNRTLEASAVAGHALVGNNLYLLMRWNSTAELPLFEVLVKIDITAQKPWFKVVNKMPGVSLGKGDVSDELFLSGSKLEAIAQQGTKWGLAAWDIDNEFMRWYPVGQRVFRSSVPKGANSLIFVERTDYGTWLAGRVDLTTMKRENLGEAKEKVSFVALDPAVLRLDSVENCRIRYVASGQEQTFKAWTAARMTQHGLLTWYPSKKPVRATLFAPGTFDPVSTWGRS